MPSLGPRALLILVAVIVSACGQGAPSASPSVDAPSVAAFVAESSATASPSAARLPTAFNPPEALEAGTYLTPEGFEPAVAITVLDGWYGGAGQSGFGVGQGFNEAEERFADAGVLLDVIPVPYDEAVAILGQLEGIVFSQPSSTIELDGHDATVFHGSPEGEPVLLDALLPGIDLPPGSHQQILIDVGGETILVRTELFSDDAEGALNEVIESLRFP